MLTLTHTYRPRAGCRDLMHSRAPELLLSGPAGTGKSRACLEKLAAVALAVPGVRMLIARKYAETLTTTALVTWNKQVVPEMLQAGAVEFYGGSAQEPPQYRFANGSVVVVGGLNKPSRIMSTEYDMVYVQEAVELSRHEWEALTTRLRNGVLSYQQIIADTNPDAPKHWLHQRCSAGATRLIESRHTDNPRYYDELDPDQAGPEQPGDITRKGKVYRITPAGEAYIGRLRNLTGVRRARLYEGLWVAAEGLVYEEYDPAKHVVEPFPIPADWRRIWTVDFGFVHPFVVQWWAIDDDGRMFRYRELYGVGRTVADWAALILACVRVPRERTDGDPEDWTPDPEEPEDWVWTEPEPEAIVCDHDAEGRVVLQRALMLPTRAAHKRVRDGIDACKQRFADGRLFLVRGALVEPDPRLVEEARPTCLDDELPGYRWDERKEAPVKIMDDACDTMRYAVAHEDLAGRPQVRF